MKLQMKREALEKLNRRANELAPTAAQTVCRRLQCAQSQCNKPIRAQSGSKRGDESRDESAKSFAIREKS
jgi:hypothetical protein